MWLKIKIDYFWRKKYLLKNNSLYTNLIDIAYLGKSDYTEIRVMFQCCLFCGYIV